MQFYDSITNQIQFNTKPGNLVAGFPLTSYLKQERLKENLIIGGNRDTDSADSTDEFKRFDGLVIPMGLYTHHSAVDNTVQPKRITYKTIADDLFDDLLTLVTKPIRKANNTTAKNKNIKNKTRRK
jgi:hypothetical protein